MNMNRPENMNRCKTGGQMGQMGRWNRWTDGNDGWTDINRWTDGMGGEMNRWNGWTDGQMDWVERWTDGIRWTDVNGWTDVKGWTDRTDGQMGSLGFSQAQTNIGMQPGVGGRSPRQALNPC